MHMNRGEILAVIGPNGAGKTSLFNSLTGVYEPQEGQIDFTNRNGRTIAVIGKKTHRIARAGVSRTFQASRVFSALTVFENVKIGAEDHGGIGVVGAILRGPATRRGEHASDQLTLELLDFVGLRKDANLIASASPTADVDAWRSRGPSPPIPTSSCWTNRRPARTRRRNSSWPR